MKSVFKMLLLLEFCSELDDLLTQSSAMSCVQKIHTVDPGFVTSVAVAGWLTERPARGDDVSSVVDVIPSASQDMALQRQSYPDLII